MSQAAPSVIVLAGPNGAGKTTAARTVLAETLKVLAYVNADTIAQGLSGFDPEQAALAAGRIMLERLRELAAGRSSFAFETTLASRSFAPWLARLTQTGYQAHLFFFWLPSADLAVERVAGRIRVGGHAVPEETIRRRYGAGLRNLFSLYLPLMTTWTLYDNSFPAGSRLIASGQGKDVVETTQPALWDAIRQEYWHEQV